MLVMLVSAATSGWSIPGWASVIGILLVVVATVAAAVAVARVSYNEARIKGLLGDIQDRDRRMEIMKGDIEKFQADIIKVNADLKSEREKVSVLQSLVTGKEQLDHLQSSLDNMTSQVLQDHKEIQSQQRAILRKLGDIEKGLEAVA